MRIELLCPLAFTQSYATKRFGPPDALPISHLRLRSLFLGRRGDGDRVVALRDAVVMGAPQPTVRGLHLLGAFGALLNPDWPKTDA